MNDIQMSLFDPELFEMFKQKTELLYPIIFKSCKVLFAETDGYKLGVGLQLTKPLGFNVIDNILASDAGRLTQLYCFQPSSSTTFGCKLAYYSYPTDSCMFIIYAQTKPSGLVEAITVDIFNSAEHLLSRLKTISTVVYTFKGEFLKFKKQEDILADFLIY